MVLPTCCTMNSTFGKTKSNRDFAEDNVDLSQCMRTVAVYELSSVSE